MTKRASTLPILVRTFGPKLALSASVLLVGSLLGDRTAAVLVEPVRVQATHPPDYHETRRSIEFTYEFRTNSMGLREREIPLRKSSREFRILVVGDSFTEGWGVADADRFTTVLERQLSDGQRPITVVNAGMSGTDPVQYGDALLTVGLQYEPDLALVVLHTNDLVGPDAQLRAELTTDGRYVMPVRGLLWPPRGMVRGLAYRLWPWTYARLQELSESREARVQNALSFLQRVDEFARRAGVPEEAVRRWKDRIPPNLLAAAEAGRFAPNRLLDALLNPTCLTSPLDLEGDVAEARWQATTRVLSEIVSRTRASGLRIAVVYAPDMVQYIDASRTLYATLGFPYRSEWAVQQSKFELGLEEWSARESVPFLSLTGTFRAAQPRDAATYNFEWDGHWNAAGHQLAGNAIAAWLRDLSIVPGP